MKISNSGALTLNNGTYYYHTEEGNHERVLTCGLVGVNQEQNSVNWVLPKKANGENPPEVDGIGHRLIFHRMYPVQSGKYICSVCNTNAVMMVDVTEKNNRRPPFVHYFHPNGTYKLAADQDLHIQTITRGTLPLKVVWQHNNSNISINSQYNLIEIQDDAGEVVLSTLVIRRMKELLQGVYKIVANNSGGITTVSPEIMLLLGELWCIIHN